MQARNRNVDAPVTRRRMLQQLAAGAALFAMTNPLQAALAARGKRLGVVVFSYSHRRSAKNSSTTYPRFTDALEMLNHCHSIGSGGLQTSVSGMDLDLAKKIRARGEKLGLFFEGQTSLPKGIEDCGRFEKDLFAGKEAGASVFRTAIGGRRYEDFDSAEGFLKMKERAWKSLRLAEPIAAKHRVKIGVENHKDWRIPDLLEFMEGLSSEYIGACLDTGNSISLLEHPMETVEAFAKHAVTTHIKDMGVKEYEDGFLLSEVPLGKGFLDLKRILEICEQANPKIQYNLEMITREPLKVPCLTDRYWVTFGEVRGEQLARALSMVRKHQQMDLMSIAGKSGDSLYELEESNVVESVRHAQTLGLKEQGN